jgi:DNA-binding LacI/PurR family transcriptional regulator
MLKLTTVDEQGVPVGRKAARLLLERIGSKTQARPKRELITPTLIIRNSTAKPKRT